MRKESKLRPCTYAEWQDRAYWGVKVPGVDYSGGKPENPNRVEINFGGPMLKVSRANADKIKSGQLKVVADNRGRPPELVWPHRFYTLRLPESDIVWLKESARLRQIPTCRFVRMLIAEARRKAA